MAYHRLIILMARGGGGGSGGGGGGGGAGGSGGFHGSGGSGNGGPLDYVLFVGILGGGVAGWIGTNLFKKYNHKKAALLASGIWGIGAMLLQANHVYGVATFIAALVFGQVGAIPQAKYNPFARFRKKKAVAAIAAQEDAAWDNAALLSLASKSFLRYQADWSALRTEDLSSYTTPAYAEHATLMMAALRQLGRQNVVRDPRIIDIGFADIVDSTDNASDIVTVYIRGQANDQLLETPGGKLLFTDTSEFTEYWHFSRKGDSWLLGSITQKTEDASRRSKAIEAFATHNQLFYSADWGWLLLPIVGEIFSDADFGTADINNHCIGIYHDQLIQLYSYQPAVGGGRANSCYTVAQVAMPDRDLGHIIVRRKSTSEAAGQLRQTPLQKLHRMSEGLEHLSTESIDFDSAYDVYAASKEILSSFELLHPAFMETLLELPFSVDLEVCGQIIFLYCAEETTSYDQMFALLLSAFKELKM